MAKKESFLEKTKSDRLHKPHVRASGEKRARFSKPPKSRPPKSLRERLWITRALPNYTGAYTVGTMEIEVPVENPRVFSDIKVGGRPLLELETVLMTIYYPSVFGSGSGKDPAGNWRWSRETWLPRPRIRMAEGYGKFSGVGYLAVPFFAVTTALTKLPAFRNPPLAEHWPPFENLEEGGARVRNTAGPRPEGAPKKPLFPLMIFSHGLGGSRTMYSSVCGEFASYGYVVVAVEHRDGSCGRTFVNHAPEGFGSMKEREENGHIKHNNAEVREGYDVVDYYFPKDNPIDTSPTNEKGVDLKTRNAQLEMRCAEVEEAYKVVSQIAHGDGETVARNNLRRKGFVGSSSIGLDGVDWSSWTNRVHLEHVTMSGHSFGAATTIEVLRNSPRFPWISQGIIYDIWSMPLQPNTPAIPSPSARITKPLLALTSEAFCYWRSNFRLIRSLIASAAAPAWLLTLRGTIHVSPSDIPVMYPRLCSLLLKATADPRRALDIHVAAGLEFLRLVLPRQLEAVARAAPARGVLESAVQDPKAWRGAEQRPEEGDVAAKLRIPHEARYRLSPWVAYRAHKRKKRGGDPGLEGIALPGEEVWLHEAPGEGVLEEWQRRNLEGGGVSGGNGEETGAEGADGGGEKEKAGTE